MKIRVDQVFLNDKKQNGEPYINKFGKAYKMCRIISDDRKITVWGTEEEKAAIKIGDVLEGTFETGEYNGYPTYSLTLPKQASPEMGKIFEILQGYDDQFKLIWEAIEEIGKNKTKEKELTDEVVGDTINPDDIPF